MPFNAVALNSGLTGISATITHVGAHTLTDPGTGTNANAGEAAGGPYARQAVAWNTAASGQQTNSGALLVPVDVGTYGFITLWNAATGNTDNFKGFSPMGGASAIKGFFSVDTSLANDQLFSVAHGLADGDKVMIWNVFAETLPTGVTEGTVYFVVAGATNTFKISLTSGGAAVDITAVGGGEGYWQRVVSETFAAPGNISIAAGALTLDLTAI